MVSMIRAAADSWQQYGLHLDFDDLCYVGERNNAETYMGSLGWDTTDFGIEDLFNAAGFDAARQEAAARPPAEMRYVTATRQ
jgi:hypothetical protein